MLFFLGTSKENDYFYLPTANAQHTLTFNILKSMINILLSHILTKTELSSEELKTISDSFIEIPVKKREFLLKPGKVSQYEYFIAKGCIRSFVIDEKGNEHNNRFGIEESWIGDILSYYNQTPASYHIQALEDSVVFAIKLDQMNLLMDTMPAFEHYSRIKFQYGVLSLQLRLTEKLSLSAEKRFLEFIKRYPHLEQRIPQKHIASYLGITPEFLSLLRKKTFNK
ncbi:Crp/Fnr family transcriptional regulator [Labilibaculum sp. DW002]|uniref:Crp/Fnr family transcriptional regulator n=1 Tax=Paralabilibaculum antarcticum TaxID=2912572 RepID=A0ABT5VM95_9BACT|nr:MULTISPECIES: Crp/Fnr family transcriptional regulator [unclassified Labilibaculum]MBI9060023.1 Crp/Fnr family transcriptional regulator [Labilibaculum sp.]MDE5416557.1 Crp/Fnr family transcriptional regulator [Labilibaculum sp. DW002]